VLIGFAIAKPQKSEDQHQSDDGEGYMSDESALKSAGGQHITGKDGKRKDERHGTQQQRIKLNRA
jgi:hypothetical protein